MRRRAAVLAACSTFALDADAGRPLDTEDVVIGANRHDPFATVPLSLRWGDDGLLHLNAGWTLVKDRFDVDVSYVTRSGGEREDRYVSLGISLQTGALLP